MEKTHGIVDFYRKILTKFEGGCKHTAFALYLFWVIFGGLLGEGHIMGIVLPANVTAALCLESVQLDWT